MISASLPMCCPVSKTAKHVEQKRYILCKVWDSLKIPMDSPRVNSILVLGRNKDGEITQIHRSVQKMQGRGPASTQIRVSKHRKLR